MCRKFEASLASKRLRYCHRCYEWLDDPTEWTLHFEMHLQDPGLRCEAQFNRHTLIYPGTCLFCLGDQKMSAERRLFQYTSPYKLQKHIERHLENVIWPRSCPHPLYTTELRSSQDFEDHMVDVHGKKFLRSRFDTGARKGKSLKKGERYAKGGWKFGMKNQVWTK